MLLFKKKFIDAIREGRKTQTVRFMKTCRFRAGQRSYIPGIGYIRIESAACTELDSLDDADALADGFESADLLREELRQLYPDRLDGGYRIFKIKFRVLPAEEQARIIAEKERLKSEGLAATREARALWFEKTMQKIGDLASPTGKKPPRIANGKTRGKKKK